MTIYSQNLAYTMFKVYLISSSKYCAAFLYLAAAIVNSLNNLLYMCYILCLAANTSYYADCGSNGMLGMTPGSQHIIPSPPQPPPYNGQHTSWPINFTNHSTDNQCFSNGSLPPSSGRLIGSLLVHNINSS